MQERQRFKAILHRRVRRVREHFLRARRRYPRIAETLQLLQAALDEELPHTVADAAAPLGSRQKKRRAGSAGGAATGATEPATRKAIPRDRKWYYQARRFQKERDVLAAKVRRMDGEKESGGQLSQEWLLRIILAKPNASARSLAQSFVDVIGSDVRTVGRTSIGVVRDAWVELYKPMVLKVGADLVAACARQAAAVKAEFAPVYLVQIQDEADIRLRSENPRDGVAVPSRSRTSKVQQSVLTIHGAGEQLDVPLELEALGDKTAATLATSLERLLRSVAASILPKPQAATPEVWLLHVVIGDGIATNDAAGKILWACIQQEQLAPGTRYFLLVLKCATHQTGLCAKSAVIGRSAQAAGGELYKAITGVASRLFKYVICDYFEEFVFSVREWVVQKLVVQPQAADEDTAGIAAAKALQTLYTEHVVPSRMLALWNNGLGSLRHRLLTPGQDPDEERPRVVNDFVQWIVKHLLHVDSHPTLSRFFTFRGCIDRMMTMSLIDMPQNAFKVRSMKPRQENQKRLRAVEAFFKHAEAPQLLRRTCLAFQLTGGVEAMVSANPTTGEVPTLVRLARGDAHQLLERRCQDMFGAMAACDPSLALGPAVTTLLCAAMDMCVRMDAVIDYPVALCRMAKRWFPHTFLTSVHGFLREPAERLDAGVGAPLQALAWRKGTSEMAACRWLLSRPVQDLFEEMCVVTLATSLPVERRHNEIKKWEASKLTHIASASRNAIAMRFLKWREEHCHTLHAKQAALRRAVRTNLQALAWAEQPESRPVGVRRSGSGSACQPQAAEVVAADAAAGLAMDAHVAQNRAALAEKKHTMLGEADFELRRALASFKIPVTRPQWAQWLSDNIDVFRANMRTATALRRQGNVRIRARPGLPAPARRIQPLLDKRSCDAEWAKWLANRTGWWGLKTRDNGVVVVFLLLLRGRTHCMELSNRAAAGVPNCILDLSFLLGCRVQHLAALEDLLADDEVLKVWEFKALVGSMVVELFYRFIGVSLIV